MLASYFRFIARQIHAEKPLLKADDARDEFQPAPWSVATSQRFLGAFISDFN
jgi:hypothetical protein